jgi:hypothetical protein
MLYMAVATHSPEICPVHNKATRDKMMVDYRRMEEVGKKLNITNQGSWTFMPGHIMYLLMDAPNAHVVGQAMMELGIMNWNTVVINPVVDMKEGMAKLAQIK